MHVGAFLRDCEVYTHAQNVRYALVVATVAAVAALVPGLQHAPDSAGALVAMFLSHVHTEEGLQQKMVAQDDAGVDAAALITWVRRVFQSVPAFLQPKSQFNQVSHQPLAFRRALFRF